MELHGSTPANGDVAAKLTRMLEISVELNSTAELDTLLTVIMDAATELTGAEAASVLLSGPRGHEGSAGFQHCRRNPQNRAAKHRFGCEPTPAAS